MLLSPTRLRPDPACYRLRRDAGIHPRPGYRCAPPSFPAWRRRCKDTARHLEDGTMSPPAARHVPRREVGIYRPAASCVPHEARCITFPPNGGRTRTCFADRNSRRTVASPRNPEAGCPYRHIRGPARAGGRPGRLGGTTRPRAAHNVGRVMCRTAPCIAPAASASASVTSC